jgi:nicotinamidase-related amidase
MKIALIIIDMQVGLFANTVRFDSEGVIQRINAIAKTIHGIGGMIIFIQHEDDDAFAPGSKGWEILPDLVRRGNEPTIRKQACDSFYKTNLAEILNQQGITKLIITGCATDFCVDTTIRAAASLDYEVTVVKDGHTTADRPHLKAEQIIQHHNYVWKNLILPNRKIRVLPATKIIQRLKKDQS